MCAIARALKALPIRELTFQIIALELRFLCGLSSHDIAYRALLSSILESSNSQESLVVRRHVLVPIPRLCAMMIQQPATLHGVNDSTRYGISPSYPMQVLRSRCP